MKRIDRIYEKLKEWTAEENRWVSAKELADALHLDRANVSSDLNKLWRKGKAKKLLGRPVRFAIAEQGAEKIFATKLDELSYQHPSLAIAVEQGKAAILYPPKGMHMLILGETGTGKSMFAKLLHAFAVDIQKFPSNAPFVTFNCADYANNPQLLLGQLFGVRKGAYTGAIEKKGLLEKADGGILFLDEVHRLPAEGQEMLFTFMDHGTYRRLGETDVERNANVLLICATTENPESNLLTTFRRRIPMNIFLPPLRERTVGERYRLVFQFFQEEAVRLGKEIYVSANTIRAFLFYPCPSNVGQLKADIQLACAKAYADYVTAKKDTVRISSSDLPIYIKNGLFMEKKNQHAEPFSLHHRYYIFSPQGEGGQFETEETDHETIYEDIERKYSELKARGIHGDELELLMGIDIENYFSQYMKGINRRIHTSSDLEKIVEPSIVSLTEMIIAYAEKKLKRRLPEKVMYGLALHIQTSLNRMLGGKTMINPQLNKVRSAYKNEFALALDCLNMIEEHTNVNFPIDEAGFLTMFFAMNQEVLEEEEDYVSIFVMMHGNGVASAIAEVVNQLLATGHVKAVDMPLHAEPKHVYEQAKALIQQNATQKGALLLVDMGSLVTFAKLLEKDLSIPVKVISAASTPHVLEAARKAILGYSLDEIYEDVMTAVPFYTREPLWEETAPERETLAIVTACLTGKGSAVALKKILETYLQFDIERWKIIPIHIDNEAAMKKTLAKLEENYRIICVVSNFSVAEHIPHFHIAEVLSLRAIKRIQEMIDNEETYAQMAEELKQHLRHISATEAVEHVRASLAAIQKQLNIHVHCYDVVGIVLHVCCMIDRLISGGHTVRFEQKEKYMKEHIALYTAVKNGVQPLEQIYDVHIDDDELCYMMEFFHYCGERNNTQT